MYTPTSRGFIPLVAIILLGLLVVAGGTIAAVSIQHNKPSEASIATSTEPATTSTADSAPVRARVEGSGTSTAHTAPAIPSTPVGQISATLDAGTKAICDQVGTQEPVIAGGYVVGMPTWCRELETPAADTPDQKQIWLRLETKIKQGWQLKLQNEAVTQALEQAVVHHEDPSPIP